MTSYTKTCSASSSATYSPPYMLSYQSGGGEKGPKALVLVYEGQSEYVHILTI